MTQEGKVLHSSKAFSSVWIHSFPLITRVAIGASLFTFFALLTHAYYYLMIVNKIKPLNTGRA